MVRRDGHTVWVRDIARLREDDGKPAYWRGGLIDITAERQAREQLAEASGRYRDVIDALPACVYRSVVGVRGRWLFVSSQIERLLGYTPEEWMADPTLWQASLHSDDRERVELQEENLIDAAAGTEIVTEYRLRHRSGDVVWVRDRAIVAIDPDGDRIIDGFMTEIGAERAAAAGSELADVFRLTCTRCNKTWAAVRLEPCPDCESAEVEAVSLNATLADLAGARQQVEGLLDGVRKHLDALGTNLHSVSAQSGARPGTAPGE
jgi:PAS domain S-box-containing protein